MVTNVNVLMIATTNSLQANPLVACNSLYTVPCSNNKKNDDDDNDDDCQWAMILISLMHMIIIIIDLDQY